MPKSPKFKRPKEVEPSIVKLTHSAAKRSKSSSASEGGGKGKGTKAVVGGGKKGKVNEKLKPVAKIPGSREEASSNWKALLLKQVILMSIEIEDEPVMIFSLYGN